MTKYGKLWIYKNCCFWSSLQEKSPIEQNLGKIDTGINIWDYASMLEQYHYEVFQVINPNSENNIELYLKQNKKEWEK